jgi:hypothetical protein
VRRPAGRRFLVGVLAIAAFGFATRVAYLVHLHGRRVDGDGNYYHVVSNLVAAGHGFVLPTTAASHYVRTAAHPPMWTLTLALFAWLGVDSFFSEQIVAAGVAAATIVVIGYAGRRIAGPSVGLIAATIAAVAPTFFFYERELLSETLAILLVAGVLLVAYHLRDRPSVGGAVTVGLLCGLLAPTHSDQGLLVVFLLAAGAARARRCAAHEVAVAGGRHRRRDRGRRAVGDLQHRSVPRSGAVVDRVRRHAGRSELPHDVLGSPVRMGRCAVPARPRRQFHRTGAGRVDARHRAARRRARLRPRSSGSRARGHRGARGPVLRLVPSGTAGFTSTRRGGHPPATSALASS